VRVEFGSPTEATSAELLVRVLDTMSAAADNKVWAWGRNSEAELGTGHESEQGLPAPVPHLSLLVWRSSHPVRCRGCPTSSR
jgi:hypothetical protein